MEFDEEEFQKLLNSTTVLNKVESEKDMESEEEIPRNKRFRRSTTRISLPMKNNEEPEPSKSKKHFHFFIFKEIEFTN
jgi:hypothetical protein